MKFFVFVFCKISFIYRKGQQCRDLAGDRSNCSRFIRCFNNLRVLFTCTQGTAYVPELKTCMEKNLVKNCNDPTNRVGKSYYISI
jgi:hypothetical protein